MFKYTNWDALFYGGDLYDLVDAIILAKKIARIRAIRARSCRDPMARANRIARLPVEDGSVTRIRRIKTPCCSIHRSEAIHDPTCPIYDP